MVQTVKNLPATQEIRKTPWRRKWQPTPVVLPGKSHGQRSLEGYSPQGQKKSDTHTHTQGEGRQRQIGERRVRRHQKIQKSMGFAEAKAGGSFQKERPTQFRL